MTEEHKIQNEIRAALSPHCVIFRVNVGRTYTPDGRYFSTGVPAGFSDLFGFRKSDGRAVFIEVKTKSGRVSAAQLHFIEQMRANGAIAGICRSPEDALNLIGGRPNASQDTV
ncbi:MAG: VRR-NUC domain-containing protein [Ruminococcus sp.]|nr:VRR-NUC domain-containing protein [Ruminococcus sp.]